MIEKGEIHFIDYKPFGVSREYEQFRPWKSVEKSMKTVEFEELYLGAAYRCTGERRP
ncbi:hypothetical protein GCM10027275_49160 [Rhabdobacter roseus]|jgi:hypothetical protein|uniref:Uncharacterized protein n=1 Tax=Rhabdobacter roseus TaxID=1655419 RepID=A0A840TRL4_9BACT|nr:hypothetical protein [Rhabdobacter roseus]MBB5286976.1 hypothetical protein [Rhabdobacter roseus]